MREDFGRISIERPRTNSGSENKHTRERIRPESWESYEDSGMDNGTRRGMHRNGKKKLFSNARNLEEKDLTDHLSPLRRYLQKSAGRSVNAIRSELTKVLRKGNEPSRHVLEVHFEQHVRPTPYLYRDDFYEENGILRYEQPKRRRPNGKEVERHHEMNEKAAELKRKRAERKCCEAALIEHNRLKAEAK